MPQLTPLPRGRQPDWPQGGASGFPTQGTDGREVHLPDMTFDLAALGIEQEPVAAPTGDNSMFLLADPDQRAVEGIEHETTDMASPKLLPFGSIGHQGLEGLEVGDYFDGLHNWG